MNCDEPLEQSLSPPKGQPNALPERSLKSRAVAYLSRREHSRDELFKKLSAFEENPDIIIALLDQLERENWQSDERYVASLLNAKSARQGKLMIERSLRQKGIDQSLIDHATQTLSQTEFERAVQVWQKRFGDKALDPTPTAYAKQARFLLARGFSADITRRVLAQRDLKQD